MQKNSFNLQTMPLTWLILGANVIIFLLQGSATQFYLETHMALWSLGAPEAYYSNGGNYPSFQIWQLLTYGFLHGSTTHLFFNMFALYMFGLPLEQYWGRKRFATYYFTCLIGAGLIKLGVTWARAPPVLTLGASGAVFGLLLAYGAMWPRNRIMLLIPPVPIQARWFVIIYGALQLFLGFSSSASNVAYFAHLGGMLFGAILLWHWGWRPFRR
ncbi:MAG: rhomboid family intramembrane serine protease [Xanthomonadales bacterium]|nr:rhomboid family intramembrane serine protease [Xanthomonadales bacterium]